MSEPGLENLFAQLTPGDVLIIIPPVVKTGVSSLAPHLLQARCRHSGIPIKIIYTNLFFSSLIGFELYNTIAEFNSVNFIGERLFARAAFDLPPMGRNIHRLIDPGWLPDHLWQKRNKTASRKMSEYLTPIRKWLLSVDWQHVENQAAQWTVSTAKQIACMNYRIVGCTNTLGGLLPAVALLHHVKKANPNIITVLGGSLCEGEMADGILSLNRGIDYIFSGESDETFPDFVQEVLNRKRPKEKIIRGREVENLDDLPLPDYREFFQQAESLALKSSNGKNFPVLYETSRGCRWKKCTFCGLTGERKSHHIKSPKKILNDLEQLISQYPASPIYMVDNLMPVQYLKNLFPRIAQKFPSTRIRYEVNARLTLKQMIVLKQTGITCIMPGIESFSAPLLKRMGKNTTIRQNIALLRYARSIGIDVLWHLLFGIPGDQTCEYEEMLELIPLIRHLQPPLRLIPVEIPRFSHYQRMPEDYAVSNLRPAALYEDILPGHADIEKIAYFFAADFKSRAYEHPDILDRLRKEFHAWVSAWKPYGSNPLNPQLPKLHLGQKSLGEFVLHDTRGLPGRPEKMVVDREQANVLLVECPWENSPEKRWALDAKLAVLRESWFIPLVTSEPDTLQKFEHNRGEINGKKNECNRV